MSKPRTIAEYPNRADDYDQAVSKSHVQNTDTVLDEGGDNEVTAEAIRDHVDSTDNPHEVTAGQVGAYTKQETDDLLDDKADQSALNATNQAVSTLDGRVDTAEDEIQGLEEGKLDYPAGAHYELRGAQLGSLAINEPQVVLLALNEGTGASSRQRASFTMYGTTAVHSMQRIDADIVVDNSTPNAGRLSGRIRYTNTAEGSSVRLISCKYEGRDYWGLNITDVMGNNAVNNWLVAGNILQANDNPFPLPMVVSESDVSDIALGQFHTGRPSIEENFTMQTRYHGTVTATDFITASRVESDNENALSALDNIAEWKKKDGTIDYKKHYAYTPRIIKDEKGKVIEEVPGLSMEKRVAMLEKMVAELSGQLQNSKTQRK